MTKPTKREPTSIETLREYLVPLTKEFEPNLISQLDLIYSERLIFLVDWENRYIYLTVVQGTYSTLRLYEGLDEEFDVRALFAPYLEVEDMIGYEKGKTAGYYTLFLEYVLRGGKRALEILESAPDSDEDEDIKSRVIAVLDPYRHLGGQLHSFDW